MNLTGDEFVKNKAKKEVIIPLNFIKQRLASFIVDKMESRNMPNDQAKSRKFPCFQVDGFMPNNKFAISELKKQKNRWGSQIDK